MSYFPFRDYHTIIDQQTNKKMFSVLTTLRNVVNAGILDDTNIPCPFSKNRQINQNISHLAFTCSNLTIETPEQCVKYVQS